MKVITAGRGAGKTAQLLDWLESQPEGVAHVIVTPNLRQSMQLLDRARSEGRKVDSWQFVSIDEVRTRSGAYMSGVRLTRPDIRYSIDNADIVLHDLVGAPISIVTVTAEAGSAK